MKIDKNKQRAILITSRPDFQDEVLLFRKIFNIPIQGLKSNEAAEQWHHEFYQSDDNYLKSVWPKKRKEILKLKKEGKYEEAEGLQKQFNNGVPINNFRIKVKTLLKKYKIPFRWENSVKRYVLFNDVEKMWIPLNVFIKIEQDEDTGLDQLFIGIDDTTTIEDIKYFWPSIRFHRDRLYSKTKKKFQPIKNLEMYKEAYDFKCGKKTLNWIADYLSVKYDKIYSDTDVSDFIRKYKKNMALNKLE